MTEEVSIALDVNHTAAGGAHDRAENVPGTVPVDGLLSIGTRTAPTSLSTRAAARKLAQSGGLSTTL